MYPPPVDRPIFAQRQARLLALVNSRGIVSVTELARRLDTSQMTIRRDLTLLDARGLLRRIRGGAMAVTVSRDLPLQRRERLELSAKAAIGRTAAGLVKPGDTILLDAGTTVLALARCLRAARSLTVVTNSLEALAELRDRPGLRVVAVGGLVRPGSGSLTGPLAERTLEEIRVDRAFLGTIGITPQWEASNSDLDLAALQRRVLSAARENYLLADHTKVGRTGLAIVGPLTAFSAVITDAGIAPSALSQLERHARKVVVAR